MKIKDILKYSQRPNLRNEERKCTLISFRLGLSNSLVDDNNTINLFDLKQIGTNKKNFNEKENKDNERKIFASFFLKIFSNFVFENIFLISFLTNFRTSFLKIFHFDF